MPRKAAHGPEIGRCFRDYDQLVSLETDECVLWPHAVSSGGYGMITIGAACSSVHVLACERAYGPRPDDGQRWEVAHSCGVRSCINRRHLRWATCSENNMDKAAHGTLLRGEQVSSSKLTEVDVRRIRHLHAGGVMQKDLAVQFGVSRTTIHGIVHRRLWAFVDEAA